MKLELIDITSFITFLMLSIMGVFLFFSKKGNKLKNYLLAAFLISNAIYLFLFISPRLNIYFPFEFSGIDKFIITSGLLYGPLLYYFTLGITHKDFRFRNIYILHLIPAIISIPIIIYSTSENLLLVIITNLQIMIYLFACLFEIRNYQRQIKSYFSSLEKINLSWLEIIIIPFVLMWFLDFVHTIVSVSFVLSSNVHRVLIFISLTINFVFAVLLFYKSLQHPEVLQNVSTEILQPKYEKSRLSDDIKNEIKSKLISFMESEKPYLNPQLTLNELADKTGIHAKSISQVLNEVLGKNFYDFVNSYRISEAKSSLIDAEETGKTVLEILYESGFNSKSVFNAAFKKHTGLTPSEFRIKKSA